MGIIREKDLSKKMINILKLNSNFLKNNYVILHIL